MAKIKTAPLTW